MRVHWPLADPTQFGPEGAIPTLQSHALRRKGCGDFLQTTHPPQGALRTREWQRLCQIQKAGNIEKCVLCRNRKRRARKIARIQQFRDADENCVSNFPAIEGGRTAKAVDLADRGRLFQGRKRG